MLIASGVDVTVDETWRHVDATICDRIVRGQHLHGRDGQTLADRNSRYRRTGPLRRPAARDRPTHPGN